MARGVYNSTLQLLPVIRLGEDSNELLRQLKLKIYIFSMCTHVQYMLYMYNVHVDVHCISMYMYICMYIYM